jgi:alpha-L-rhamnosidase
VHACWDVMLHFGATTAYETAKPGWAATPALAPNGPIPAFQDGFTSLAHPWSSGATQWTTQHLAGIAPQSPGYATYAVAPHLAGSMRGVAAVQPLQDGAAIAVRLSEGGALCVGAPPLPRQGVLRLSRALLARTLGLAEGGGEALRVRVQAQAQAAGAAGAAAQCTCSEEEVAAAAAARGAARQQGEEGAAQELTLAPGATLAEAASLPLAPGACNFFTLTSLMPPPPLPAAAAAAAPPPSPFPPAAYPAVALPVDLATQGSWLGKYGAAGHYLVAFDGPGAHRVSLPPWVESVEQVYGPNSSGPWLAPPPGADPRALVDPAAPSGPRRIGQYSAPPPPEAGWAPSFPLDVRVRSAAPAGSLYQFAFYFCDYDARGRRQSVQLMDGDSLNDIAPVVVLEGFQGGAWLVWQWAGSVRLRVNFIRGTNQVVSAVLFDVVSV